MKTLDRYLAGIFVRSFLLATFGLTVLFLFQELLGELFSHHYPPSQVLFYNLMNVPYLLTQMMPPAVMLATVFTLAGLSRSNELVACYSIGIGIYRILALFLSLVFIISCAILVMEDRILPPVYKKRTLYYQRDMKHRTDFFMDIKQDKVWYRSKNLIYNLQVFDARSNTIQGMSVYTFDDQFHLVQVIEADRAEFTRNGWRLLNGTVTVFNNDDPFPMTQKFSQKDLIIAETPRDFMEIEKEVDSLRLKELYRYIQRMKLAGADTKGYEVKFHSKLSLAVIPIIMCVLGLPFALRNRREGGFGKDLGLCLLFTFFYWLFNSIGLSLGTYGALPPWLAAWIPSVLFLGVALTLLARRVAA